MALSCPAEAPISIFDLRTSRGLVRTRSFVVLPGCSRSPFWQNPPIKTGQKTPARPTATASAKSPAEPTGRWWPSWNWKRALLLALAAAVVLPVAEVGCVRFANPPATPLMGLRWLGSRLEGRQPARVQYRWLPWSQLPTNFLRAAWVSEDSRFFVHHGFDWIEMRRAIEKAQRTGGDPRGSSTITMQCARSLFLWQGHSYVRKGLEAYYTVLMEAMLSKKRILELYANVIEMGPGVYGIEAASEHHFQEPARRLTTEQAALLAALLPNPLHWDPRAPTKRLRWRQQHVLHELPLTRWNGPPLGG